MKATLLHFIFDVAAALFPHITQYLGEYPFQRIIANLSSRWTIGVLYRLVAVVTDVESSAVEMTGILCGIPVTTTKLNHIFLRT